MSPATVTRSQVLGFRVRAQQLDRATLEVEEAPRLPAAARTLDAEAGGGVPAGALVSIDFDG